MLDDYSPLSRVHLSVNHSTTCAWLLMTAWEATRT